MVGRDMHDLKHSLVHRMEFARRFGKFRERQSKRSLCILESLYRRAFYSEGTGKVVGAMK